MSDKNLRRRGLHGDNPGDKKIPGSPKSPPRRRHNQENANTPTGKNTGTPKSNLYPDLSNYTDEDELEEFLNSDEELDNSSYDKNTPSVRDKKKNKKSPVLPKSKETHSDCTDSANNRKIILWLGILFIALVVGYVICKIYAPVVPQEAETKKNYYEIYSGQFSELKNKYPSQSSRFWRIVNAPLRRLLTAEQSDFPAVLLFGVPSNGSKTAQCFTNNLIKLMNKLYNTNTNSHINAADLSSLTPAEAKLSLDMRLQQILSRNKGVILDHLERLPAEGGLLLHGYCDGDNAPFKESVIVLVFHTDKNYDNLDEKTFEDHLTELWEAGLGADEMPALLSRIANNVAIIKPDNAEC